MENGEYELVYGGNLNKKRPDYTRCAKEVPSHNRWNFHQCSRKRGYGPDEAYCKQHAKRFEK